MKFIISHVFVNEKEEFLESEPNISVEYYSDWFLVEHFHSYLGYFFTCLSFALEKPQRIHIV